MRVEMVIIDPQNSFCNPKGELPVTGADKDQERLSKFIKRNIRGIDDIHATLDTHRQLDVAHPLFWKNKNGEHPKPFTIITHDDVLMGRWVPFAPKATMPGYGPNNTLLDRMLYYTKKLEENGRYALCIWYPHCLISTPGHNIYPCTLDALMEWELVRYGIVDYITKGTNMFTEHYSGVQADVDDPQDPTTKLNMGLINTLQEADLVLFSGEALSHCLKFTMRDILSNFGQESIEKCGILVDTCSSVPGFEKEGQDFLVELVNMKVQIFESEKFNL